MSGGAQTGKAGKPLPIPAVVRVVAADGGAVAGVPVNFSAPAGGSVGAASVTTDAAGQASTSLTLGGAIGPQTFAAVAAGFPVSIPATATAGDPVTIAAVSGGGQADVASHTLANPLVARVSDAFDNPVSGITVSWSRTSGSGALAASASTTGNDGRASVMYTLGNVVGTDVVAASVAGVGQTATFALQTIAAPPGSVTTVSGSGQTGPVLQQLPAPLVVFVADAAGNPVTGVVVTWTATNGTLSIATTSTDASGQTSNRLRLGPVSGASSATATVNGQTAAFTATATPGAPARLAFTAWPGSVTQGATIVPSVVVDVQDAQGNLTTAAAPITLSIGTNPGGALLGGTLTRAAIGGRATFNDLSLSAPGVGYTLVAASPGLPSAASPTFNVGTGTSSLKVWTGAVSTDWAVAGNWSGGVPAAGDSAIVGSSAPQQPKLTGPATVGTLQIGPGAILDLGNFDLTVTGDAESNGTVAASGSGSFIAAGASRTMSGTFPQTVIIGSITIDRDSKFTKALNISGGSLTISSGTTTALTIGVPAGTLTVAGGTTTATYLNTSSSGIFSQTGGTLAVTGTAVFAGGPTTGRITAGELVVGGGFYQSTVQSAQSFAASGTHRVTLNGTTAQLISFDDLVNSTIHDLRLAGAGSMQLNGSLRISGQLSTQPGAMRTLSGLNYTLTVTGLAVDSLTVVGALLASTGGTIAQFDNVTLQSQPATGTALTISHPGTATPFTFNNIKFTTIPTSGAYVRATDTAPSDGSVLTINLVNATPSDGSAATVTSGGAVVRWLPPSP